MTAPTLAPLPVSSEEFQDPTTAIAFAVDCLEDFEIGPFLMDWRARRGLEGWLQHVISVRAEVAGFYSDDTGSPSGFGAGSAITRLLEATRLIKSQARDMPLGISIAFLAAAVCGFDPRSPGGDAMTLEELAKRVEVSPTTMSQHLRYLGPGYRKGTPGLGLVETARHPDNGRKKIVFLTAKGRDLMAKIDRLLAGPS